MKKTEIEAIHLGNTINMYINGKLHKKTFSSKELSDQVFGVVLDAKKNPTEKNIAAVMAYLNDTTRIAHQNGLQYDVESGSAYMAGFNNPLPKLLVETIEEYHENNFPLKAITNFWKLLMVNPDVRVREDAFAFIKRHDFSLTDYGYLVTYKAVDYQKKVDNDLTEFVTNQTLFVKTNWKCSPNKYVVYKNLKDGTLAITKHETAEHWDAKEKNVEILGKLGDLNADIVKSGSQGETVYTDNYTHKMSIKLGVPVNQERKTCNGDPKKDCSDGLHVGTTGYVNSFGRNYCENGAVLVCLVNPAHIIAIPDSETNKMRVCEYFPVALATYTNGKIEAIGQKYFESDYKSYEESELAKMILSVQKNELPIQTAKKATPETRTMEELKKIIESRIIDLATL